MSSVRTRPATSDQSFSSLPFSGIVESCGPVGLAAGGLATVSPVLAVKPAAASCCRILMPAAGRRRCPELWLRPPRAACCCGGGRADVVAAPVAGLGAAVGITFASATRFRKRFRGPIRDWARPGASRCGAYMYRTPYGAHLQQELTAAPPAGKTSIRVRYRYPGLLVPKSPP